MPDVKLLPSPIPDPYAGQNVRAVMDILNVLGKTEVLRRQRSLNKSVLDTIIQGQSQELSPEEIQANIAKTVVGFQPEFSTGIPGIIQQIASPFAATQGPTIDDIIAGRLIEGSMREPMETEALRADIDYKKARAKALKRGSNRIKELVNEGYTPAEAKNIMDIFHGLKPRASATRALEQKSLPDQLSFWQTVYNKTLDPEWGSIKPTDDMAAARELAKQNLDRITSKMRQSTQTNGAFGADLENALSAIRSGAPRDQVYERLIQAYPDRASEIRQLLGM